MRIAQVVQGLPPESLGGTETYVLHLAQELLRLGHDVKVFSRITDSRRPEHSVDEVSVCGVPVVRVNNVFRDVPGFRSSYVNSEIASRFGVFLDMFSPHAVHFHHLMYLSTTCIHEAVMRAMPVIMTLHDYWLICQRGRFLKPDLSLCPAPSDDGCARCFAHLLDRGVAPLYRRLRPIVDRQPWIKDRLRRLHGRYVAVRPQSSQALQQIRERMTHVQEACREVTLFLAPSQFLREKFLAFGIPAEKIVHAACGIPTPASVDERGAKPAGPPVFGYIGVLDPVKGVHLLVEAFQGMTDAELRLYGGETDHAAYPDRGLFLDQLRRSPHIRVMGRYENRDVASILSQVDVVVAPSIWYENAPLVIREAFLARRPVITADLGGMREMVRDGVDGVLFRPRDVADLRRALRRFVADPGLARRLSKNVPPVKSIAEDARDLEARYTALRRAAS